jgi:hypothetical protein
VSKKVSKRLSKREQQRVLAEEMSRIDRALAARRKSRAAQLEESATKSQRSRQSISPPQRYHKCAKCGTRIKIEFKRCRKCAGIRVRPDVDAIERRLPGSFESNSR